ncbi:MAG: response regulator transcription factor, partial [Deltaproteobacteria bacterium]|nr:response regulator transcription factor [Deltaproteobacteria bacterium]
EEALYMVEVNDYDLILLDIMLPRVDGMTVLKQIRKGSNSVPILLLTAKDSVESIVEGLDAGGDDYLTKPFAFSELLARIRALLRRDREAKTPVLQLSDLRLSPLTHEVTRGGKKIPLTAKEYALLEYFMRNPNRVLTRTMISEHVWDYHFDTDTNVVDVYVNFLRKKIDRGFDVKLIHTIRGVGYMMKE